MLHCNTLWETLVTNDYKTSSFIQDSDILQEKQEGFLKMQFLNCKKTFFDFAGLFPAFDNITEKWCRGCVMCNSSQSVEVNEV